MSAELDGFRVFEADVRVMQHREASVVELANLYAAYARDVKTGSSFAPTFADAIRMHELVEQIVESNRSGKRVELSFTTPG